MKVYLKRVSEINGCDECYFNKPFAVCQRPRKINNIEKLTNKWCSYEQFIYKEVKRER